MFKKNETKNLDITSLNGVILLLKKILKLSYGLIIVLAIYIGIILFKELNIKPTILIILKILTPLFIGLFLALVFVVSVGSIMYFKCISDASKDKARFDTLRKIGTSQEYINKSIYKQVGIFFVIPVLVAIIHSIVAGYCVTSMFNQDGRLPTLITIIGFCSIYLIYYLLSTRKYINLTK